MTITTRLSERIFIKIVFSFQQNTSYPEWSTVICKRFRIAIVETQRHRTADKGYTYSNKNIATLNKNYLIV